MSDPAVVRGRLVLPERVVEDGVLRIEEGRFTAVEDAGRGPCDLSPVLEVAPGLTVLPGLVDLHCHGGGGSSFSDPDPAAATLVSGEHLRHGTTAVMASLVTAPIPAMEAQVARLAAAAATGGVAGVHLEGPWLAARYRGAHSHAHLRAPDPAVAARLVEAGAGHLRTVTLAPELPGAVAVTRQLTAAGVTVAVGHTGASPGEVLAAVDAGAILVTHLFNGMPPLRSRDPGPVAGALEAAAAGRAVVELVADGVHLDDATVRLVFALLGPQRVALVTDATAAAGMPDGRYSLGGLDVVVNAGVARLAAAAGAEAGELPSLAGGTRHLLEVVQRVVAAGVPIAAAVCSASATPAAVLGNVGIGALEPGRRADLVVVDEALAPVAVLRAGRWCWGSERVGPVLP